MSILAVQLQKQKNMLPDKIKEKISETGTDFNETHMYYIHKHE